MISYDKFLNWAEKRFGDVKISGNEIKINSIFCDDYKYHLWCNPTGGKKELPYGAYRCWKTDKTGSLISLVMKVDNCSFDEALDQLDAVDLNLLTLNKKIEELFVFNKVEKVSFEKIKFPEGTYKILELNEDNLWRTDAEIYLKKRKMPIDNFYICTKDSKREDGVLMPYKNRIIIPYYDQNNNLIYWNARLINENNKIPKYLGPHKDCGVGKSDVIYFPSYPIKKQKLYITEGEIDAYSIFLSGLYSAALGGKSIEEKQIELIRGYIPVLCFDTDDKEIDAGGNAIIAVGDMLKSKGFEEVYYVRPPKRFKDWNKMHVETSEKILKYYILKNEKEYTNSTKLELNINF